MLRDVVETDLPIFYEQQLDPTSTRMAAFPPREEWSVFLAHWKTKVLADPANCAQTIVWNERVAGYIASWSQEERRLIAYWIGREYWGRGIATARWRSSSATSARARSTRSSRLTTSDRSACSRSVASCGSAAPRPGLARSTSASTAWASLPRRNLAKPPGAGRQAPQNPEPVFVADAHLDHRFFQITKPRLGARPSLGSLAHLEGDRLTQAEIFDSATARSAIDAKTGR